MNSKLEYIRTKKYEDLTKEDIRYLRDLKILNGFGGAGQSWIVRWIIGLIVGDFDSAIPDKHDFGYWVGVRSYKYDEIIYKSNHPITMKLLKRMGEYRRIECDEKFYQAMLNDFSRLYDKKGIGKWGLIWKALVACLAYYLIRWKGSKFFNYS